MNLKSLFRWIRPYPSQAYRPVILITGASTGLGLAMARMFSKVEGYRVVLTAREKSILKLRQPFIESVRLSQEKIWRRN